MRQVVFISLIFYFTCCLQAQRDLGDRCPRGALNRYQKWKIKHQ